MSFRITGLPADQFNAYFTMTDEKLRALNIEPAIADDSEPGYPCRVRLAHAEPGERLILINYQHLQTESLYRSAHAIYVAQNSDTAYDARDEIPEPIRQRLLSIRAFDRRDMMTDAEVVEGGAAETLIERLLDDPQTDYLHIHFANRGCYAARVERSA